MLNSMFKWLSTGRSDEFEALRLTVRKHKAELDDLSDQHERLKAQFLSLRGSFYRAKGLEQPGVSGNSDQVLDSREARKRQAFAKLGIVPGKPVKMEN
jgi:hypothetical protein